MRRYTQLEIDKILITMRNKFELKNKTFFVKAIDEIAPLLLYELYRIEREEEFNLLNKQNEDNKN